MKRCNRCGAENKDDSRFCQNCGTLLNSSQSKFGSNRNLIDRFKNANIIVRILVIVAVVYLFLLAYAWAGHLFFGIPIEPYTEGEATYRQSQYDNLDIDGDGALSINEVENLASDIGYGDLQDIFDRADKNDNGVLMGSEFDGYIHRIDDFHKDMEKQKAKEKSKQEQTGTPFSTGNSIPHVKNDGKCPECGSGEEYIYDDYDEFGRPYYRCTVCGHWTYDDGDFYDE